MGRMTEPRPHLVTVAKVPPFLGMLGESGVGEEALEELASLVKYGGVVNLGVGEVVRVRSR